MPTSPPSFRNAIRSVRYLPIHNITVKRKYSKLVPQLCSSHIMWVKKVRVFSRIPQLPMKASIHIQLSSVVSSVEHSRVVTDPIQVSVKHLHNVAFATRLRVIQ